MKTILAQVGVYSIRPGAKRGFEVYKDGAVASTRVAIIGYEGDKGWKRAMEEIARRISNDKIKQNPRKRKSAPSKKNPSTRTLKPREIATRYKFCVEFSDDQKKWNEYGAFTAREIAEDIAHHLAKKYPTVYIRVSDKTRKV